MSELKQKQCIQLQCLATVVQAVLHSTGDSLAQFVKSDNQKCLAQMNRPLYDQTGFEMGRQHVKAPEPENKMHTVDDFPRLWQQSVLFNSARFQERHIALSAWQ